MKNYLLIALLIVSGQIHAQFGQIGITPYWQTANGVRGISIGQPGATFTPALYVRGDLLDNGTHSTGEVFETVGLDNVDNAWRLKTKNSGSGTTKNVLTNTRKQKEVTQSATSFYYTKMYDC